MIVVGTSSLFVYDLDDLENANAPGAEVRIHLPVGTAVPSAGASAEGANERADRSERGVSSGGDRGGVSSIPGGDAAVLPSVTDRGGGGGNDAHGSKSWWGKGGASVGSEGASRGRAKRGAGGAAKHAGASSSMEWGAMIAAGTSGGRPPSGDPVVKVPYEFKVFVYEDVIPRVLNDDLRAGGACKGGYAAAEGLIPHLVSRTSVYTANPELADFYLVPILLDCYVHDKLNRGVNFVRAAAMLNRAVTAALDNIMAKYPHWSRTEGRDHVFVFPTERGPSLLSEATLGRIRKAIFLTGVIDRDAHGFSSWKDIVIPPVRVEDVAGADLRTDGARPFGGRDDDAERKTLLHFRGVVPGHGDRAGWGVRNTLRLSLEGETGVSFLTESVADTVDASDSAPPSAAGGSGSCGRTCGLSEMRESHFCLAPGGVEGWSLRLADAVAEGCVPVLMSDRTELPYEGQLDWSTFAVKAAEASQGEGRELARRLRPSTAAAKRAALSAAREKMTWHATWRSGDAFDALLEELRVRLRFHRNSPYRFYAAKEANG